MQGIADSYFALFGLPVEYRISRELLGLRYRELQHRLHPDRFAATGDLQRRLAVQQAAYINQAYQVLGDPIARAKYLLELHGADTSAEGEAPKVDNAFLLEQMELRESLGEVRQAPDPHWAMARLMERIQADTKDLVRELEQHLDQSAPRDPVPVLVLIDKMQYLDKLRQQAERIEAELDHF